MTTTPNDAAVNAELVSRAQIVAQAVRRIADGLRSDDFPLEHFLLLREAANLIERHATTQTQATHGEGEAEQKPVLYSLTFNGSHPGNTFTHLPTALSEMRRMNEAYPKDARTVVPLYTHPAPSPTAALPEKMISNIYEIWSAEAWEAYWVGVAHGKGQAAAPALGELAKAIVRDVSELPDRTSPDDKPEMMLVTSDELLEIVERQITSFSSELNGEPVFEAALEKRVQEMISGAPEPLRELGKYLGSLLDEDQWPQAERYLLKAAAALSGVAAQGDGEARVSDYLECPCCKGWGTWQEVVDWNDRFAVVPLTTLRQWLADAQGDDLKAAEDIREFLADHDAVIDTALGVADQDGKAA